MELECEEWPFSNTPMTINAPLCHKSSSSPIIKSNNAFCNLKFFLCFSDEDDDELDDLDEDDDSCEEDEEDDDHRAGISTQYSFINYPLFSILLAETLVSFFC